MKVLGIVTARGGSKGIPRKNLVELGGKSLLAWTAEVALDSCLDEIVLSTDDPEIAEVGETLGLRLPCMRPPELARDDSPAVPVLQHMVQQLQSAGEEYDAVFTLQPTNPLRLVSDIEGAVQLLEVTGADSVIGFANVGERHPARMKAIDPQGKVSDPPFAEQQEGQRRQELTPLFLRDGSVYLTRTQVLMHQNSLQGEDCRAWIIPKERAWNIDEPFDLVMCENLLRLGPHHYPGQPGSSLSKT